MKYVCQICGYVYDEAVNPPFDSLPEDWRCPLCGAAKSNFKPEGGEKPAEAEKAPAPETVNVEMPEKEPAAANVKPAVKTEASKVPEDLIPLSPVELSALCSNLARGCEKQYKKEEAAAFARLAQWFKGQSETAHDPSFEKILEKVNTDLSEGIPAANAAAKEHADRGALRCLTWGEKVTVILKSLLTRFSPGGTVPENTGVYVCTICGFVFIGDVLPEVCPVCKVPNFKFEKIGG